MNELECFELFPTPIFAHDVEDSEKINQKLKLLVREIMKNDPVGNPHLNPHCYQSQGNLHKIEDFKFIFDKFTKLLETTVASINGTVGSKPSINAMWACVNNKYGYNNAHVHQNSNLTGVYYVQAPEKCGNIVFHDPRVQLNALCPPSSASSRYAAPHVSFVPKAGRLIIFPSWLLHHVNMNLSEEERILLGFNCSYT